MSAKTANAPSPAAEEVASLQVSLPQMLDLALGTPEVGAVNLNILHNFLHILLHRINLGSTTVEYRGDDANRIKTMVNSLREGPSLYLQEYNIIDDSGKVKDRVLTDAISAKVDVLVDGKKIDLKKTKGIRKQIGPQTEGKGETVIFVEPIVDGATPTALSFKHLEQNVKELQQRFQALEDLATTPELLERLKGKITDPLTDVWQIINITKRLDASEQGIDKLIKTMQDVIKGDVTLATADTSRTEERLESLENALNNLDRVVKNLQLISEEDADAEAGEKDEAQREHDGEQPMKRISLSELLGGIDIKEMHKDVATLQTEVSQMKDQLTDLNEKVAKTETEYRKEIETAEGAIETKKTASPEKETEKTELPKKTLVESPNTLVESPNTLVESPNTLVESPKTLEKTVDSEELQSIRERLAKLEKDVIYLFEKVDGAPMAGADIDDLISRINDIQAEMKKLSQTVDRLIDDRESREMHLNALFEQVELLKTIKADREDLEEALADKADAQAIHRKVSYDQFDAACDDLAHGLEDAIYKLGQQEEIWQQALNEVQKEMEGKVDKIEISPLKDFVHHRLKSLQDKLKKVAEARQEIEAAGTKKLLRDVQCISCDKDVVMRMDPTHKFKAETLPCTTSMKPYLTYELDQVRKQHRRLPHSRNMIQFEAAMQEEAKKQKSARDTLVKTPRDHLCNRYCGGSHTITTPQQRVTRMGHFLTQWGPEIVQLTEGVIKGTDGKIYKSRRIPNKIDVCGAAYCNERGDELRSLDKQSMASAISQSTVSRKTDKQFFTNSKKRPTRRQLRDVTKEVIEEFTQTSRTEIDDEEFGMSTDTDEYGDRIVQFIEEEEMGEQD
ncbi:glutamine-rich protein 2-like [Frieseomelitta varia]|uniref:glutamine-rich protein 2-like n=1 Tax=Frieseomelitta varia TaxID=561572 RepID=UPI001CB67A5F|nr:glutamine-rich protein 2-like [Frieseomelitta varia]